MQTTNEQDNNINAAQTGMSEEVARAGDAAQTLCEWMPPNVLAELVDYWVDEQHTLPLAQIAFDAGVRNCGALQLAKYVVGHWTSKRPTDTCVLNDWKDLGIKMPYNPSDFRV